MILVTGAAGATGRAIVRSLVARGIKARALVHKESDRSRLAAYEGIEAVVGSLEDDRGLQRILKGIDVAYLVSSVAPDMVDLHCRFIDSAKSAGVKRIVRHSALGAAVESGSRLLSWHGEAERYLESSGMAWTHVRPNFFMQNFSTYFKGSICAGGSFATSLGQTRVSMVDVRDIAAVAAEILTGEGHAGIGYAITGPEALTMGEAATILSSDLGYPVRHRALGDIELRDELLDGGAPDWMADAFTELYGIFREGRHARIFDTVEVVGGKLAYDFNRYVRDHRQALVCEPIAA
ncbi:MAG: SDR family oxidoreductase [Nitrospinae bacterium]|nr:SDR family oxidoreductase [Nitrospinota bacterium]